MVGKRLVGGIRLWQLADSYLGSLGAAAAVDNDYTKGFRDISWLGQQIVKRWEAMCPKDQARLTTRLSTETLGDMALWMAVGKLSISIKITEALEELGAAAKEMGGGAREKATKFITQYLDELMPVPGHTGSGFDMPIPKERPKVQTTMAMSKPEESAGFGTHRGEGGREREPLPERNLPSERFATGTP